MTPDGLRRLLDEIRSGTIDPEVAHRQLLATLRAQPLEDLGFAKVDHHRTVRQGFPEVILGLGKTAEQIASIAEQIVKRGHPLLITRVDESIWSCVRQKVSEAEFHPAARAITLKRDAPPGRGTIALVSAGTSDLPVAEEAAVTAELMGNAVERVYDVGVAGIHRLLRERTRIESARVVIVVAGMEGALPSVVAGMISAPVIAVPTSVGYGASFGGIAALLGMLNSCANGVSVVNIDNGYGAGCIASMINHL
ncbi:MAG: nickel pincer cofactor biosynthesis protein LarB [Vicinamibacterales bacterium]